MTEKRFYVAESKLIDGYCVFDREKKYAFCPRPRMADCLNDAYTLNELAEENEQLKQDRDALIHLLENQSMIIEELHSKLLEYQLKEPIVLTKEDLNLMDKAISYYTHGRYLE